MSEYFNIYENIDQINIAELKRAAGLKDPDKVVWPKGKKYKVQLAGKECTVTTSFANAEGKTDGYHLLDAYSALSTMMTRDEVVDKIHKEDPNGHTDADLYATAEFLPGLPKLTDKEVEQRRAFTAAILTLLSDQKTIEVLAECAPRKKNGLFAKGRVFKIGLTGLAEPYNSELIEIVGKSKDETKMIVSVLGRNTSPDELEAWNQDFISTYHEGLPISEALRKVFKNIKSKPEPQNEKPQKIVPDLYGGLGDGTQEIDLSKLMEEPDYLKGVHSTSYRDYKKEAQDALAVISKNLVDPNAIVWDGKGVFIDSMWDDVFRVKVREMGAIPLSGYTTKTDYIVCNLDYRTYMKRNPKDEVSNYTFHLRHIPDYMRPQTKIIEEKEFLKWCVNGHKVKFDISKNEHLKKFEGEKVAFKKINPNMFIKQAIKITEPEKKTTKDWDNTDIYYCVIGSGAQAEKIRHFFKSIGKAVMDKYIEGAKWSRLILEDPDGEEEKQAYAIALYNQSCGIKVQVWSAKQVLDLIDIYGNGIKECAEKSYDNAILEQSVEQIIESSQSGITVDAKDIEGNVALEHENNANTVMKAIKRVDSIDFEGKAFVFTGNEVSGLFGSNDPDNPNVKKVLERGGLVRKTVSGKTDYFVVNVNDQFVWIGAHVRDAAAQLKKRDTLTVITLDNLLEILDK